MPEPDLWPHAGLWWCGDERVVFVHADAAECLRLWRADQEWRRKRSLSLQTNV